MCVMGCWTPPGKIFWIRACSLMPFLEQQRQLQKTEKGHIHTYIYETVREQ